MAVPKKRTSRARRDKRRAHHALHITSASEACASCGELKLRHHVCLHCGQYMGAQIIPQKAEEAPKAE
jgi:large subunit ribosomal protein L32